MGVEPKGYDDDDDEFYPNFCPANFLQPASNQYLNCKEKTEKH